MRKDGQRVSIRNDIDTLLTYHLPHPNKRIWIVDTVLGSDTTGNGKINKPYQTIGKALTVASAWDTIIFWGSATENITISLQGLRLFGLRRNRSKIAGSGNTDVIILSAEDIELGHFFGAHPTFNGDVIQLTNAHHCWIHHLYIGTTATGSGINGTGNYALIEKNILEGTDDGITLVATDYAKVLDNHAIKCVADGIALDVNCNYNEIGGNKLFENGQNGLGITGSNNYIFGNDVALNTSRQFEDYGNNNRYVNNKHIDVKSGTHTTTGVTEEIVLGARPPPPNSRLVGYLRLNNLIGGDDFDFRVKKSYDKGVTYDIIDETNIAGAPTVVRYSFDEIMEDEDEWVQVTVQRNSGTDRAFYNKYIMKDA